MENEPKIFHIPGNNLQDFLADIAKLSKRAVRLGFAPFSPTLVSTQRVRVPKNGLKPSFEYDQFNYSFNIDAPVMYGWRFVATIDHSMEGGNLVRPVLNSGVTIPVSYRTANPICEHCNIKRYRRDTFVLFNQDKKEFKQVGRSCLQDFFKQDTSKLERYAEILSYVRECGEGMEDYEFSGGSAGSYISLMTFLQHAAAIIRVNGWVSRKKAKEDGMGEESSSANQAIHNMSKGCKNPIAITAADRKLAEDAAAWAIDLENKPSALSDYEYNAMIVAKSVAIQHKHIGIAASIVAVFMMHCNREAEKKAAGGESSYVGKVKDRLRDVSAKVVGVFSFENSTLYKFAVDGNFFGWYASSPQPIAVDDMVKLTGTVKRHGQYKGVKVTYLSRCSISKV